MDIRLSTSGINVPAFTMTLEMEQIAPGCNGGLPRLSAQVVMRRTALWDQQTNGVYPIISALHGVLFSETAFDTLGATLYSPEELPFALPTRETEAYVKLQFVLSEYFVRFLEEERLTKQGSLDMRLAMRLWGTVALATSSATTQQQATMQQLQSATGGIAGLVNIRSETYPTTIRIPRSDWIDRFLPGLGYERSVLVELPLTRTPPIPEPLKQAAAALEAASKAFKHEDYRAVLKYGRDVLEHIGNLAPDKRLTTFCQEKLAPVVGKTKSEMMDGAMNVLRGVLNAGAHANDFIPDRAIAAYVVETLAIQLRYISAVVSP